jgi:hypothetical protein
MRMFSSLIKTGNHTEVSLPAGMEEGITLIEPIEFGLSQCARLRDESGDKFSEELV